MCDISRLRVKMCDFTNAKALIIIMFLIFINKHANVEVKQSRYRPEQAQRVDRGIALTFRELGT
jgi:hypothetical protein